MAITGGTTNGAVMADLVLNKQRKETGLRLRYFIETVTLAAQANGATIGVGFLKKGVIPLGVWHNISASLVTSTISIGIAGAAAKYRAAAVSTVVNQWVKDELNAAVGVEIATDEEILITIGVANLPGAGTLRVAIPYLDV